MSFQFLKEEFNKLLAINEKFSKWENEFNKLLKGKKLLAIKFFKTFKKTPIDWDTLWIESSIGTYTLESNADKFEDILKGLVNMKIIKDYRKNGSCYDITDKDGTLIQLVQLTDFVPDLDEGVKKRLHSKERAGHCHWDSIHLAEHLKMPNKVVSGYCTMQSKKMPFPHSWVELEHQGKEWVLDFTMNQAMNKEGYYKLYNPRNTIAIDSATLKEDLGLRKRSSLEFEDIRMYIFHPNEARAVMQEEIKSRKTYKQGEHPWILIEE